MKPPQIPGYTATPPKKAKRTNGITGILLDETQNVTEVPSTNNQDSDSAFVSQLLGPLSGNMDESPPTPAPIYSAGKISESRERVVC